MGMSDEEFKKELDQRIKKATQYINSLLENNKLRLDCPHRTNLKYFLENNKERIVNWLVPQLHWYFDDKTNVSQKKIEIHSDFSCFDCGKDITYLLEDGILTAIDKECFKPEPFSVEIEVPSGNLILIDWPHPTGLEVLGHLDKVKDNINCFKGKVERSNKYSLENILHVFVGNSSPSVYIKNDLVLIGKDAYGKNDEFIPLLEDGKDVGFVSTELWWVTAFDFDVYLKLAQERLPKDELPIAEFPKNEPGIVNIQVKPGVYRCTHYYGIEKEQEEKPRLFTKLEWQKDI